MFEYIVVGKGLIGAAAARYLSEITENVAIIGPDEPMNWETHQGVFASHYDQGRITRVLDVDKVWALLAQRSIQKYRAIEQESGVIFYYPVNGLQVSFVSDEPDDFITNTESSNELGRLAAGIVKNGEWIDDSFDEAIFEARYQRVS